METTQREQQAPRAALPGEGWERGPEFCLQVNDPALAARGCVIWHRAAVLGMLVPNPPPRGAAGDSPLCIIIPDTFLVNVLSVSLVHGLPIQFDWKKRAFKQFKSLPVSYTNALIPHQDFVTHFFSLLL